MESIANHNDRSSNTSSEGERDNNYSNSSLTNRKLVKRNENQNHGHNENHNHGRRLNSPNFAKGTGTSSSPFMQSQSQSQLHRSITCPIQTPTTPHQTYEYDKAIAALKDIKDLVSSHKPWLFGLESGTVKVNETYGPSCQPTEVLARSLVLPTYQLALSGIGLPPSLSSKMSSVPVGESKNIEIDKGVEELGDFSVLGLSVTEVKQVESELFALREGLAEERELSGGERGTGTG